MACASCTKRRQAANAGLFPNQRNPYPLKADDILVLEGTEVRRFALSDWPDEGHKLIVFIPETFTPVCATELGAIRQWAEKFKELDCRVYVAGSDSIHKFREWYENEESLKDLPVTTISSYLLPARLGLMENGRVKRSSVFITDDGTLVKQEHFEKVGRSFAELHRMLYGYVTGSYCAEGWQGPEDGFLVKKEV